MQTNERFIEIRKNRGLTQEELAEKLFISRQAVSRWENGETIPSIDTLKMMSKVLNIPINALLGAPVELYCQACGMPLREDDQIARDTEGAFDEKHCKWCFVDGKYVGPETIEEMIEVCVPHMGMPHDQARKILQDQLPKLEHWKR